MSEARPRAGAGRLVFPAALGYVVGSILTATFVAKAANRGREAPIDLRTVGSGNPGAANTMANLGTKWGVVVLLGDMLKGAAAAFGGRALAGGSGGYTAAIAAVAGHCFPAWNRFNGGKGVATASGATLALFPLFGPVNLGIVLLSLLSPRHSTKASAVTGGLFIAAACLWQRRGWPNLWGPKPTKGLPVFAAATTAIVAYRFATAPDHMGDVSREAPAG